MKQQVEDKLLLQVVLNETIGNLESQKSWSFA